MGNDILGLAAKPPEPPPVVAELRRALDALAAPYGELVVVSHLDADPDFDPAGQCPVDAAWITSLEPTVQGQRIEVRYDGIDRDLFLFIGEVGFLEWWDHSDINSVVAEAAGICAGVMAGDIWEWRTAHERGCEVVGPDALFGVSGSRQLRALPLDEPFRARVNSQLRLLEAFDAEIARFDDLIRAEFRDDPGYRVIQRIDGIGPVLAAVLVAELGDVARFTGAPAVCSWAGLTPKHRESDLHVHHYEITKQGSRLVRWAAIEAVQRAPVRSPMRHTYDRIVTRRGGTGKNLAKVAAARKLLTLVYYGLRDGEIRCLTATAA